MESDKKASTGRYPVDVSVSYPAGQSRAMALFNIPFFVLRAIMAIPHFIVLYIISFIGFVVAWLNQWVILFTGKSSPGMHKFVVGTVRWSTRVSGFVLGLTDKYPPFSLDR